MTAAVDVLTEVATCRTIFVSQDYTFERFEEFLRRYRETLSNAITHVEMASLPEHILQQPPPPRSEAHEIVRQMNVVKVSFNSPLEIILATPYAYTSAALAALLMLPRIVRRFSRLKVELKQDRFEQIMWKRAIEEYKQALSTAAAQISVDDRVIEAEEAARQQRGRSYDSSYDRPDIAAHFVAQNIDRMVVEVGQTIVDSDDMGDDDLSNVL
jgi:hypothetical protein